MTQQGSTTQSIKNRINIVDVVKRYVTLTRAGNRWVAPCPFHQETKPSFSVNEEEGFYYCFGCQAAGDLFDFYGRINGLDFKETLIQLAEEAGVTLATARPDPKATQERDARKLAVRMYEHATRYFQQNLKAPVGLACREYLENRKIDENTIEIFELGWSLAEWNGLSNSLASAGYTLQQGEHSGLLAKSERGSHYDRFRGRLTFPIKNLNGKVIAFGGRIIGEEDVAKYINSTDSVLYKKGEHLYGLFQARRGISALKTAILTEGYMDVLTLHQFGYTNACGVLGTALTPEQIRRLAGFCSDVELIFDGDAPGRKAALRACEMILAKGLRCNVIMLPDGKDIDDLLQKEGKEAFEELRQFAPEGLDFCIRTLSSSFAPKEALEWVKSFVGAFEYAEFLPKVISRICQGLDLDEREIRRMASNKLPHSNEASKFKKPKGTQPLVQEGTIDKELMSFVVRYPHHAPLLKEAGLGLVLTEKWAHSLWEKVILAAPNFTPDTIAMLLDTAEKEFWVQHRVVQGIPLEHEVEELADVKERIMQVSLEKQDNACLQALRQSVATDDDDLILLRALNETLALRKSLGRIDE